MTQIQVDRELQTKLGGLAERVTFCDSSGQVVGRFLPEKEYLKLLYASYKSPLSEEEIARRESEPGGFTLQEIWQQLGRT